MIVTCSADRPVGSMVRRGRGMMATAATAGAARSGHGDSHRQSVVASCSASSTASACDPSLALDGRDARGQRGRPGADGRAHGWLLAAGIASPAMRFSPPAIRCRHPKWRHRWAVIGISAFFLLRARQFGRTVYAIGNRERAAYLYGARTGAVVITAFAIAGGLRRLAAYCSRAPRARRRGDGRPYFAAIAAVVWGARPILGGRGNFWGPWPVSS